MESTVLRYFSVTFSYLVETWSHWYFFTSGMHSTT